MRSDSPVLSEVVHKKLVKSSTAVRALLSRSRSASVSDAESNDSNNDDNDLVTPRSRLCGDTLQVDSAFLEPPMSHGQSLWHHYYKRMKTDSEEIVGHETAITMRRGILAPCRVCEAERELSNLACQALAIVLQWEYDNSCARVWQRTHAIDRKHQIVNQLYQSLCCELSTSDTMFLETDSFTSSSTLLFSRAHHNDEKTVNTGKDRKCHPLLTDVSTSQYRFQGSVDAGDVENTTDGVSEFPVLDTDSFAMFGVPNVAESNERMDSSSCEIDFNSNKNHHEKNDNSETVVPSTANDEFLMSLTPTELDIFTRGMKRVHVTLPQFAMESSSSTASTVGAVGAATAVTGASSTTTNMHDGDVLLNIVRADMLALERDYLQVIHSLATADDNVNTVIPKNMDQVFSRIWSGIVLRWQFALLTDLCHLQTQLDNTYELVWRCVNRLQSQWSAKGDVVLFQWHYWQRLKPFIDKLESLFFNCTLLPRLMESEREHILRRESCSRPRHGNKDTLLTSHWELIFSRLMHTGEQQRMANGHPNLSLLTIPQENVFDLWRNAISQFYQDISLFQDVLHSSDGEDLGNRQPLTNVLSSWGVISEHIHALTCLWTALILPLHLKIDANDRDGASDNKDHNDNVDDDDDDDCEEFALTTALRFAFGMVLHEEQLQQLMLRSRPVALRPLHRQAMMYIALSLIAETECDPLRGSIYEIFGHALLSYSEMLIRPLESGKKGKAQILHYRQLLENATLHTVKALSIQRVLDSQRLAQASSTHSADHSSWSTQRLRRRRQRRESMIDDNASCDVYFRSKLCDLHCRRAELCLFALCGVSDARPATVTPEGVEVDEALKKLNHDCHYQLLSLLQRSAKECDTAIVYRQIQVEFALDFQETSRYQEFQRLFRLSMWEKGLPLEQLLDGDKDKNMMEDMIDLCALDCVHNLRSSKFTSMADLLVHHREAIPNARQARRRQNDLHAMHVEAKEGERDYPDEDEDEDEDDDENALNIFNKRQLLDFVVLQHESAVDALSFVLSQSLLFGTTDHHAYHDDVETIVNERSYLRSSSFYRSIEDSFSNGNSTTLVMNRRKEFLNLMIVTSHACDQWTSAANAQRKAIEAIETCSESEEAHLLQLLASFFGTLAKELFAFGTAAYLPQDGLSVTKTMRLHKNCSPSAPLSSSTAASSLDSRKKTALKLQRTVIEHMQHAIACLEFSIQHRDKLIRVLPEFEACRSMIHVHGKPSEESENQLSANESPNTIQRPLVAPLTLERQLLYCLSLKVQALLVFTNAQMSSVFMSIANALPQSASQTNLLELQRALCNELSDSSKLRTDRLSPWLAIEYPPAAWPKSMFPWILRLWCDYYMTLWGMLRVCWVVLDTFRAYQGLSSSSSLSSLTDVWDAIHTLVSPVWQVYVVTRLELETLTLSLNAEVVKQKSPEYLEKLMKRIFQRCSRAEQSLADGEHTALVSLESCKRWLQLHCHVE